MATYVIYDRKTGQVVQTHVQAAETSQDEILGHLGKGHDAANLEVKLVDENTIKAGQAYRFDVSAGRLEAAAAQSGGGFGAGSIQRAGKSHPAAPGSHRKTVFQPAGAGKPPAS